MDLGPVVGDGPEIQGVAFEEFAFVDIKGTRYRILRVHGITRDELTFAIEKGTDALLARRRESGLYPRTHVR